MEIFKTKKVIKTNHHLLIKDGNKHVGSSFDSFLKKEGILEEVEEKVKKRITEYGKRKRK